jgi:hypothetical protein
MVHLVVRRVVFVVLGGFWSMWLLSLSSCHGHVVVLHQVVMVGFVGVFF